MSSIKGNRANVSTLTSIEIVWENWGLCCVDDIMCEKFSIYRRNCQAKLAQYNGRDELTNSCCATLLPEDVDIFFQEIAGIDASHVWDSDFYVEVCDGCHWIMKLRYGRTQRRIEGTVELPTQGEHVMKLIYHMLDVVSFSERPVLFG